MSDDDYDDGDNTGIADDGDNFEASTNRRKATTTKPIIFSPVDQAPPSVKSLEPATVEVSLHNNTPLTLTKCRFEMEGTVLVADDDTNNFDFERTLWFDFGTWRKNFE